MQRPDTNSSITPNDFFRMQRQQRLFTYALLALCFVAVGLVCFKIYHKPVKTVMHGVVVLDGQGHISVFSEGDTVYVPNGPATSLTGRTVISMGAYLFKQENRLYGWGVPGGFVGTGTDSLTFRKHGVVYSCPSGYLSTDKPVKRKLKQTNGEFQPYDTVMYISGAELQRLLDEWDMDRLHRLLYSPIDRVNQVDNGPLLDWGRPVPPMRIDYPASSYILGISCEDSCPVTHTLGSTSGVKTDTITWQDNKMADRMMEGLLWQVDSNLYVPKQDTAAKLKRKARFSAGSLHGANL